MTVAALAVVLLLVHAVMEAVVRAVVCPAALGGAFAAVTPLVLVSGSRDRCKAPCGYYAPSSKHHLRTA